MSWEDKPLKRQGHNSVPQRYNRITDEWEVETTEADPVYDADVLAKIQELDEKVQGIIDGTTPANTKLTGSTATLPTTIQNFPNQFAVSNFPSVQDVAVTNQIEPLILQEQRTEADGSTLTFSENIHAVDIYNRDVVGGVFTINGMDITVPADTFFEAEIGGVPSNTITVSGTSSFVIGRYA